jgi:hypothetical protein
MQAIADAECQYFIYVTFYIIDLYMNIIILPYLTGGEETCRTSRDSIRCLEQMFTG